MYLIYDTETSSFPNKKAKFDHPLQARVMQLAFIEMDEGFNITKEFNTLIKPSSPYIVDESAFKAHGKTRELCEKDGMTLKEALTIFEESVNRCKYLVAHNIKFDNGMLEIERLNAKMFMPNLYTLKNVCTMEVMTNICKIKTTYGKYKWPKLQEAYRHFFYKDFEGAHDALYDVRATGELFKHLIINRIISI